MKLLSSIVCSLSIAIYALIGLLKIQITNFPTIEAWLVCLLQPVASAAGGV